jgi:DNA-directed RNA polymerase specialized sigma24 family protein
VRLTERDQKELLRKIYSGLEARGAKSRKSDFFDSLALRTAKRASATPESEAKDAEAEAEEALPVPLSKPELEQAAELAVDELIVVRLGEFFSLIEKVVLERDDDSFQEILKKLESKLKVRGLLYRRGLDPEREYPALWSKIWEALPKWDGRDFRAYVAQLVRNYCLDDLKRRKKAPGEITVEVGDVRPVFKTEIKASTRDALDHVLLVIEDLERAGDLAPLDGVIFALLTSGRAVQDISEAFSGDTHHAFAKAVAALAGKKKLDGRGALALKYLLDGLQPDEVAALSGLEKKALGQAAAQLVALAEASEDVRLLVRALCREGVSAQDVEKLESLTPNAINLRINRARLKVWMALCDRSHDLLRRRGAIDEVDLAIVQHRCSVESGVWCRMYKDRTCKRERTPDEIGKRAGLSLTSDQMSQRVEEFREKILDGLGRAFPDYNSCLNERKPDRGRGS